MNFKFNLLPEDNLAVKALNGLDLMAEYDARTVNIGAHYQLWKDHINLIAELNNGKYFFGGIYFKIHLNDKKDYPIRISGIDFTLQHFEHRM